MNAKDRLKKYLRNMLLLRSLEQKKNITTVNIHAHLSNVVYDEIPEDVDCSHPNYESVEG